MTSNHYSNCRVDRNELIQQIGLGKVVESFAVDKGHKDGSEIHIVTSTGLIVVFNRNSHKMVTILIARPNQINRYYDMVGRKAPEWLLNIAYEHFKLGYHLR